VQDCVIVQITDFHFEVAGKERSISYLEPGPLRRYAEAGLRLSDSRE
jgi:hypothetical protein